MRSSSIVPFLIFPALALTACSGEPALQIDVGYAPANKQILVIVNRDIKDGEQLHARVRMGAAGDLDCAAEFSAIPRVDGSPVAGRDSTFGGPVVDPAIFEPVYDTRW